MGPIFIEEDKKGGHQWLIEFETYPEDLDDFVLLLDEKLQSLNSDYEAKRFKDMALECLKLESVPSGTFNEWLRSKGKFGGQNKVPRLSNDRKYLDSIRAFYMLNS